MIESPLVRHINAQCQSLALYLHKPSGMRYAASLESAWSYELNPLYGQARHARRSGQYGGLAAPDLSPLGA
jgi:hypothetical protein